MQRSPRLSIPLEGAWHTLTIRNGMDTSSLMNALPDAAVECPTPGCIAGLDVEGASERWFFHSFTVEESFPHWELLLEMSCSAVLWVNGAKVGSIDAAFVPAEFVVTSLIRAADNFLAIRCTSPPISKGYETFLAPCILEGRRKAHIERCHLDSSARKKRASLVVEAPEPQLVRVAGGWQSQGNQEMSSQFRLGLASLAPWHMDKPVSHAFRIDYGAGEHGDSITFQFGFSEFNERAGKLYLNNRPVFLKGVRYAPFYPAALRGESLATRCQADVAAMAELGFNAVLCEGLPSQFFMMAAENAGILVGIDLSDSVRAAGPIAAIMERYGRYGCLGFWRIESEDPSLAEEVRAADPKRLVFHLAKTAWEARFSRAYQESWEPFEDLEVFVPAPADYHAEDYCRHVGSAQRLSLVSAFGLEAPGSAWAAPEAPQEFLARSFQEAFQARDLERVFPDPAAFIRAATTPQCDLARLQIDAFRGNNHLSGYFYDTFADLDDTKSRGIFDSSRKAKLVLETLKVVQRPLRPLIHMSSTNLAPRAEIAVTVLIANEIRLEDQADLILLVVGPTNQVLWKKRRSVKIAKHGKELWSGAVAASGSIGPHRLVVRVMRGTSTLAEASQDFLVVAPPEKSPVRVHVLEHRKHWAGVIQQWCGNGTVLSPIHVIPPLANTIRAYPDHDFLQTLAQIKGGALGIIIEPPADWNDFADELDPELRLEQLSLWRDSGHAFQFAKIHPLFEGLPNRTILRQAYRRLAPRTLFCDESIDESSGAWIPGESGKEGDVPFQFANGITSKRYGAGRLLFLHYRVLEGLEDDPLSARFFVNLLTFAERRSVPPSQPLRLEKGPAEWIRARRVHETRQWAVLGVFPNDAFSGHEEAYGPEQGILLDEQYPGKYEVVRWRKWHTLTQDHHYLDLDRALSPLRGARPGGDHGTAYAYAEFNSDLRHGAKLVFKSENMLKIWMNGTLLFSSTERNEKQQEVEAYVKLGKNTLLVKCSKGPGPFGFDLDIFPENRSSLQVAWWRP